MSRDDVFISVVIPLLNEAEGISIMLATLTPALEAVSSRLEIIGVDDGSEDATFAELVEAHRRDTRVKGLRLSRHFGKEAALLAGLSKARGEVIVTMDGDLQHPPELIPAMVERWRDGALIVHGVKKTRAYGGMTQRVAAQLFNQLFTRLAGFSVVDSSDFKLLDARVARLLVEQFPEHERFHRGLSTWVGFRQDSVSFSVPKLPKRHSRWRLRDLFRYGWNTLTAYSSVPLHVVPLLGGVMFLVSLALGTEALVSRLLGRAVSGYASLEITLLFVGSMIMFGLGIIGQYLARVYDEIKRRPVYIAADECGFGIDRESRDGGNDAA